MDGNVFIKACLDFLGEKVSSQLSRQEGNNIQPFVPLSVDVVAIFLRILHSHSMYVGPIDPSSKNAN
jgi:hypothetical protein